MKVVLQDGMKDCGVCCLLSIIRFYGGEVSKEYLRELTNTTKEGVSLYHLLEAAKRLGFDAIGVEGNLENITVNNLPCIAHFIVKKSFQHFVVIYDIDFKKQRITLMDPEKGKKIISFSEFRLLTSSHYLFLKPTKKLPIMKKKNVIPKYIKISFHKQKKSFIFMIVCMFSFFIFNVIVSFHFKYLLDYAIYYQLSRPIWIISFLIGVLYIFKNMNLLYRNVLLMKWSSILDQVITSHTYKQILLLPYLYYKNRTTGEVISRLKDLNTVKNFIQNFFAVFITDLVSMILFFVMMLYYQQKLSFLLLGLLLIRVFYLLVWMKKKKTLQKGIRKGEDTINSYMIQGIQNVDTTKGSHLEKRMIDQFGLYYKSFLERVYQYQFFQEIHSFFQNNWNDFLFLFLYGLGSYEVIQGRISLSSLIVYQSFVSYFLQSYYRLTALLEEYPTYKIALERIEEIFMIDFEMFQNHYFYLPYTLEGDITFQNVTYQVGSKKLLDALNVTIRKGDKILLSGESGCGKSTLFKMLLRYIEVPYQNILICGIDINHYHLENIRSHITYVTSHEYLFTDTLRNNICLYKEGKEEELEKVCEICQLNHLIQSHTSRYDMWIEEDGFNFSNGERQRIVLARSLMRKSNIYIFDEAFSGIDVESEKKILQSIFSYLSDKTVIVISHRFHNKKLFQRVLRLEKGKIYEN